MFTTNIIKAHNVHTDVTNEIYDILSHGAIASSTPDGKNFVGT